MAPVIRPAILDMRRAVLVAAYGALALGPAPAAGVYYHPRGAGASGDLASSYDYVVVGGGTAGLTVADRLSADGRTTVLVVEYGEISKRSPVHTNTHTLSLAFHHGGCLRLPDVMYLHTQGGSPIRRYVPIHIKVPRFLPRYLLRHAHTCSG